MAYIIQPAVQNNPDTYLGVSIAFGAPGVFTPLLSAAEQGTSNLKNLLLTRIGERVHQPTFGTRLLDIIFQPSDDEIKQDVTDAITGPVNFWLPYITINKIDVVTHLDDPSIEYQLRITINFTVNNISTNEIVIFAGENGQLIVE
jgi:phage baseplate assembly protein W